MNFETNDSLTVDQVMFETIGFMIRLMGSAFRADFHPSEVGGVGGVWVILGDTKRSTN
jgi:hypothetical protein